jgi:hypothetical protein
MSETDVPDSKMFLINGSESGHQTMARRRQNLRGFRGVRFRAREWVLRMIQRTFAELVTDLRMRRTVGDKPPVLLLGAGASVDAGIGAMPELYKFFGCADFDAFCAHIDDLSPSERYRYLSEFLQTRKPADVTPGYQALATLCAQNYFDLVLTTNMDPLLDDALAAARLWRRDYLLIVNGVIRPDRLAPLLGGQSPRVKVVKLHGDLFQRFMAWTVAEMDTFLTEVLPDLTPAVAGRDFLVVGYSLRDVRVRGLVEAAGGSIWFTHPKAVPDHLEELADKQKSPLRAVVAPESAFEKFFPALAAALQVAAPSQPLDAAQVELRTTAPASAGAQTLDDLMSSTFAIAGPGGMPSSTAFLVADPRVIVCDTYASAPYISNETLELIASNRQRFTARVLRAEEKHPFGPTVLEAPASLQVPGLRLSTAPLKKGEAIQVLVAAGDKTGISTGVVKKPRVDPMMIAPVPDKVRDLAALECLVAPGSSGAPVVDGALDVRGFVVAGSMNPNNPLSFAYPAQYWADALRKKTRRRPVKSQTKRPRRPGMK